MTQTVRPFSPGLEGVVAGETALSLVDGANGRLLYRGYPIGELVERGTYAQVAELLWTGISASGAIVGANWPPTLQQARTLTGFSPSALAAFGRLRDGLEPIDPDPDLPVAAGFLYQLTGTRP